MSKHSSYRGSASTAQSIEEIEELLASAQRDEFEAIRDSLKSDTRRGVLKAISSAEKRLAASEKESHRVHLLYQKQAAIAGEGLVCVGLDEVGRGPVAGPVYVGAVVLPDTPEILWLNDSKKLREKKRQEIASEIKRVALAYTIVSRDAGYIDSYGIASALRSAFSEAVATIDNKMPGAVQCVLLDGNPMHLDNRERNVIKGDATCAAISAASIIAKVARDAYMIEIASEYPRYAWDSNKGYASADHIAAIKEFGLSKYHRKSFCENFMQDTLF